MLRSITPERQTYATITLALVTALGLSACGGEKAKPVTKHTGADFAVRCPENTQPGITNVNVLGALPVENGKAADAAVAVTCLGQDGAKTAPEVIQDTTGDGDCLGYRQNEHHLEVLASSTETVEFFSHNDGNEALIGVVGAEHLEKVSIHHHDLSDPFNQRTFQESNC